MEHVFAWGSQAKEVGQTLARVLVNGGSVAEYSRNYVSATSN
jgi:hypothetical protein